jgi:hypothetical protein
VYIVIAYESIFFDFQLVACDCIKISKVFKFSFINFNFLKIKNIFYFIEFEILNFLLVEHNDMTIFMWF